MKTSRLKNIVIVLLLLVNVFLLVLLLSRRAEERDAYARSVDQLVTLYASGGIALDPSLLTQEGSAPSAALERDSAQETAFAAALLGEDVTVSDTGGGVYYYESACGSCAIRAGGAVETAVSRAVDDPADFCRGLFRTFGYTQTASTLAGGSGSVTAVRSSDRYPVFNATLTLSFSGGTLVAVSGTFLPSLSEGSRAEGIDAITALVRFYDYRASSGLVCTDIRSLAGGYLLQSSATAPLRLLPVWCIETDVNSFYVNCTTGEITRE